MRKIVSLALAVMMVFSMTIMASAANTTTLTTTVPDAEYTLSIPADQEITFGATSTNIGVPSVSGASGFADGKNIKLVIKTTDFSASGVSTTIPITLHGKFRSSSASAGFEDYECDITPDISLYFWGLDTGTVEEKPTPADKNGHEMKSLLVNIKSADWGKALGGAYTATVTFSAEVVVE